MTKPVKDEFGHILEEGKDFWESRSGVALALEQLAPLVTSDIITSLINFYVSTGLGDRNEEVQSKMLFAGITLVSQRGKVIIFYLFCLFFLIYFFHFN